MGRKTKMENEGYKTCTELKNLTPQIIEEWHRDEIHGDIKLVRRQIFLQCPLTDELVSEKKCNGCPHNYGEASIREIYCVPGMARLKSARTQRKAKDREKVMMLNGEYITVERP